MLTRLQNYAQMMHSDPLGFVIYLVSFAVAILTSLILHECAHGYVAWRCGDPTAKMMGRLSLNPARHLDPVGTICMVLLRFGWARPVPVNPRNFRNFRRDDFLVAIAGIVTNFCLFLVCGLLSAFVLYWTAGANFFLPVRYVDNTTAVLDMTDPASRMGIYNLFADYLLDGSAVSELTRFMAVPWLQHVLRFLMLMAQINISLAVFNFLPIPPLDGYHILNDILLRGRLQLNAQTFRIAQFVLLILCWTGALSGVLGTVIGAVDGFFLRFFLTLIP